MSKYDPLWKWIAENGSDSFQLSYEEIEKVLGFEVDHSFLNCKKELLMYGYKVGKISLKTKKLHLRNLITERASSITIIALLIYRIQFCSISEWILVAQPYRLQMHFLKKVTRMLLFCFWMVWVLTYWKGILSRMDFLESTLWIHTILFSRPQPLLRQHP